MDERLRAELVQEITDFLERHWPQGTAEGSSAITDRQLRLAAAVLMVSVVRVDRSSRQDEHRALERALSRALDLETEEAAVVARAAEDTIARGASFAETLRHLDAGCTTSQKLRLVEALWRIAFADAELAGQEEYLVRKIAGKLGLTTADLMETKVRAREKFLKEDL
ncbi:MAG: TerB family tellurite resistance protein [Acidobacteria bacterium]|nr:TerB family tellurite resistance protein [Acidobacteriota bacterium]